MTSLKEFHFIIHPNEARISEIKEILFNSFGEPSIENNNIGDLDVWSFNEDEIIIAYAIKCTDIEIEQVRLKMEEKGIDNFIDFVTLVRKHFHPTCLINEVEHEGIAYENELDWEINYTEGPLKEFLGDEEEVYLFSVRHEEIGNENKVNFINLKFKSWIKDYIEKK